MSVQAGCVIIVGSMRSGALDLVLNGAETLKTEHDQLVFAVAVADVRHHISLFAHVRECSQQAYHRKPDGGILSNQKTAKDGLRQVVNAQ